MRWGCESRLPGRARGAGSVRVLLDAARRTVPARRAWSGVQPVGASRARGLPAERASWRGRPVATSPRSTPNPARYIDPVLLRHSRARALTACSVLVLALFGTAAFAPLPFSVAAPGLTVDVLGKFGRTPVITVSRVPVRVTTGQLRMVTIQATGPSTDVHLGHVIDGWFRTDRAVMPREAVYPSGGSETEIERHNLEEMKGSQARRSGPLSTMSAPVRPRRASPCGWPRSAGPAPVCSSLSASSTNCAVTARAATSRGEDHCRDRDDHRGRQGRRRRRSAAEDPVRRPGRCDRFPGAEGRMRRCAVRTPARAATGSCHDAEGRGLGASGTEEGRLRCRAADLGEAAHRPQGGADRSDGASLWPGSQR